MIFSTDFRMSVTNSLATTCLRGQTTRAHEFQYFVNRIFANPDSSRRGLGSHSKKGLQKRPDFNQRIYCFRVDGNAAGSKTSGFVLRAL